jgi:hypothetical protein
MKIKIATAIAVVLVAGSVRAQFGIGDVIGDVKKKTAKTDNVGQTTTTSAALPFAVKLAGQSAVAKGDAAFATIEQPVADNAELEIAVDNPEMVIINAFPSDEKGNVKENAVAAIIIFQKTNKGKIDQTMDKKKLVAGVYLMNIVAGEKTSRVVFRVK